MSAVMSFEQAVKNAEAKLACFACVAIAGKFVGGGEAMCTAAGFDGAAMCAAVGIETVFLDPIFATACGVITDEICAIIVDSILDAIEKKLFGTSPAEFVCAKLKMCK